VTVRLLFGDEIRSHVLNILAGDCFIVCYPHHPELYILSPWISNVDIEFSDLYILKEKEKLLKSEDANVFLFSDYNIKSINLPYALLLLKLHSGVEINIVTLPPSEPHYSSAYLPRVRTLLDFLDEIGCNIFVNSKLHSKLLLANDLALLGSFNLSSLALYDREEIGVSINDLDNLSKLKHYCWKVTAESERYGYSSLLTYGNPEDRKYEPPDYVDGITLEDYNKLLNQWHRSEDARILKQMHLSRRNRITRGWLLDQMINEVYMPEEQDKRIRYGEFFFVTSGYDRAIKSYAHDLNLFYLMNIRKIISSTEGCAKGKDWIKHFFDFRGEETTDSILEFLNSKFARRTIPDVKLRLKPLM